MTAYKTFEIRINNAKNGKTEIRDYAITVTADADGDRKALTAVIAYATDCLKRYKAGTTYSVVEC